jgi:hypothetical protein
MDKRAPAFVHIRHKAGSLLRSGWFLDKKVERVLEYLASEFLPDQKKGFTVKTRYKLAAVLGLLALSVLACSPFLRTSRMLQGEAGVPLEKGLEGAENGERIYFTAIGSEGDLIRYRGGPEFGGMMMGSYLTCAACHGPGGGGGTHYMHMQVMDAPDIRYQALVEEAEEHGGGETGNEHGDYSLDEFRRAVVEGEHPDGEPLSRDMPNWQISDQDLEDLFEFLKTLP